MSDLPQETSFTITAAVCAVWTKILDQEERSLCVSTRNVWASTPCLVPDRVPNVNTSAPPNAHICFPECTNLQEEDRLRN